MLRCRLIVTSLLFASLQAFALPDGQSCEGLLGGQSISPLRERLEQNFYRLISEAQRPMAVELAATIKALSQLDYQKNPVQAYPSGPNSFHVQLTMTKETHAGAQTIHRFDAEVLWARASESAPWEVRDFSAQLLGSVERRANSGEFKSKWAEMRRHFIQTEWIGGKFDPTKSSRWVDHLRSVLESILIPLAIGNPNIAEVGLGFAPDSFSFNHPTMNSMPSLYIFMVPGAPDVAWAGKRVAMAEVTPQIQALKAEDLGSVAPEIRKEYLVVYDEMRDQSVYGRAYAVHRLTTEVVELNFNFERLRYEFKAPQSSPSPE